MTQFNTARNEAPTREIARPSMAMADMPLVIPLLLYLSCASVLIAASGIALSVVLEPEGQQFSETLGQGPALAAAAPDLEPAPDASSLDRPPAWIAPTPKYDLPTPPVAKRAVENARKAANERQRRARAARQRRDRLQPPEMSGDASSAYGFAGPPRLFFNPGMR